jgi:ribosome recycling factor
MTELPQLEKLDAAEVFTNNGLEPLLKEVEDKARALEQDMTSEDGRELIRSTAFKIAKFKNGLDNLGKELVADWKKKSAVVDAERRKAWTKLESLQHEVRQPLTEWEDAERNRVDGLKARIQQIAALSVFVTIPTSAKVRELMLNASTLYQHHWQEFQDLADINYEKVKGELDIKLAETLKHEAAQAELEKLRKEAAERTEKAYLEGIARAAAEKARKDAQAKAEAEHAKVGVRNNRKEAIDMIKDLKNDGLSEDMAKTAEEEVQKITNGAIKKVDDLVEIKEKDIMTV